jgi:hypothetical protein
MNFFIGMQFAASMNAASMNEPLREPRILTAATHGLIHPGLFYSVVTVALRRTAKGVWREPDAVTGGGPRVLLDIYIYIYTSIYLCYHIRAAPP